MLAVPLSARLYEGVMLAWEMIGVHKWDGCETINTQSKSKKWFIYERHLAEEEFLLDALFFDKVSDRMSTEMIFAVDASQP